MDFKYDVSTCTPNALRLVCELVALKGISLTDLAKYDAQALMSCPDTGEILVFWQDTDSNYHNECDVDLPTFLYQNRIKVNFWVRGIQGYCVPVVIGKASAQ